MIKKTIKRGARALGMNVVSLERLGVEMEADLQRLSQEDPLSVIFDVGGNFGQTALRLADAFPRARIFTFEPVPQSFKRLRKAIASHPRIEAWETALGERPGTQPMILARQSGRNSLIRNGFSPTGEVQIRVSTVDAVARAREIETIDLLKIDVEGYELEVLRGARRLFAAERIRYVFAECVLAPDHDSPHTSFFDLHRALESHGFCCVSYYAESFDLRQGCALGNVLYGLKSRLPQKVPGKVRNIA